MEKEEEKEEKEEEEEADEPDVSVTAQLFSGIICRMINSFVVRDPYARWNKGETNKVQIMHAKPTSTLTSSYIPFKKYTHILLSGQFSKSRYNQSFFSPA